MHSSTALYQVSEIRAIEEAALATLPTGTLMQRAGEAAARVALKLSSEPRQTAPVLVLAGPGNNGGDALETAFQLANSGLEVVVLLCADLARQSKDSQRALAKAKSTAARFLEPTVDSARAQRWSLIIDGLFGIGLTRPIAANLRALVETINSLNCPVLALDVPSGIDADTGAIVGDTGVAIRATHTVTFIGDKPGLHTFNGRDFAGEVEVANLRIEHELFPSAKAYLNSLETFTPFLRHRQHNSHKGSFGDVIVVGGAHGMGGAPILAARAASKCGAGRVFAAFIDEPPPYDSVQPELMCRYAPEMDFTGATLVVGPGLGISELAHDILSKVLHAPSPIVLDADALNLIAAEPGLQQELAQRSADAVITPHPLEAARLLGTTAKEIQADRPTAAAELAQRLNAVAVLKGSGSIIAKPDGALYINTTGNPALATAGTGDVLAGICGALVAQSFPVWNAALAATWLHGQAADTLLGQGTGPIGMTASELIPCVRTILNQLTQKYAPR
ncbi:MAG TPA: NAD(P)H-hydrate dehydratase [Noviherbaspirillum sp.]|nr:NAD(P)H-hydrate dehydratase [Noviherbaspirillum sp.]